MAGRFFLNKKYVRITWSRWAVCMSVFVAPSSQRRRLPFWHSLALRQRSTNTCGRNIEHIIYYKFDNKNIICHSACGGKSMVGDEAHGRCSVASTFESRVSIALKFSIGKGCCMCYTVTLCPSTPRNLSKAALMIFHYLYLQCKYNVSLSKSFAKKLTYEATGNEMMQ